MAVSILIRKGTKAALIAHGPLATGEIGFVTDEKTIYAGDGTNNYLVGQVRYGTTDPSGNLIAGTLYTNTANDTIWFCDGTTWYNVGAQKINTIDDVPDGTSYKRVAAADVDSNNHVTQIYDGTTPVTATEVDTHMNDVTIHRSIDDSGTTDTDLWSAQKIQASLNNAVLGLGEFQDAVKSVLVADPPATPATGDRYVIAPSPTGAWVGNANNFATWNGTAWVYTVTVDGMAVYADDTSHLYVFNNTSWFIINNFALATSPPGTVSSGNSAAVGVSSNVARSDHNHNLGVHPHADATSGGQVSYGVLIDVPAKFDPTTHGSSAHEGNIGTESEITFTSSGGHDHDGVGSAEVSYVNLSNVPASFIPSSHNTTHKNGGSDEVATATPAANAIPKAGVAGTISDGWLPIIDGGVF